MYSIPVLLKLGFMKSYIFDHQNEMVIYLIIIHLLLYRQVYLTLNFINSDENFLINFNDKTHSYY